jgi:hypothetical protein
MRKIKRLLCETLPNGRLSPTKRAGGLLRNGRAVSYEAGGDLLPNGRRASGVARGLSTSPTKRAERHFARNSGRVFEARWQISAGCEAMSPTKRAVTAIFLSLLDLR